MGDKNAIIVLLLIIIVAGGILGYRKYCDLTGNGIQIVTQSTNADVSKNSSTNFSNITSDDVYNTTKDFLNSGIGSTDVEKFNSNFKKYAGEQTGITVRLFLNDIRDYNAATNNNFITVEFEGKSYIEDLSNVRSVIELGKTYNISFEYDSVTQYIQKIIIKPL